MNLLYFDTSTDWITVQIWNLSNKELLYNFKKSCPREASYRLTTEIKKSLVHLQNIKPDIIVIAKGPGSFTGIRIAVTTARNLSQLWNIPCYGIDTLEVYLDYYTQTIKIDSCLVAIDGKMKKYFVRFKDAMKTTNTQDLTLLEMIDKYLKNQDPNFTIISNISMDIQTKVLDMNENYPDLQGCILSEKLDFLLDSSKSKEYNYTNLIPNYMRGTYVD